MISIRLYSILNVTFATYQFFKFFSLVKAFLCLIFHTFLWVWYPAVEPFKKVRLLYIKPGEKAYFGDSFFVDRETNFEKTKVLDSSFCTQEITKEINGVDVIEKFVIPKKLCGHLGSLEKDKIDIYVTKIEKTGYGFSFVDRISWEEGLKLHLKEGVDPEIIETRILYRLNNSSLLPEWVSKIISISTLYFTFLGGESSEWVLVSNLVFIIFDLVSDYLIFIYNLTENFFLKIYHLTLMRISIDRSIQIVGFLSKISKKFEICDKAVLVPYKIHNDDVITISRLRISDCRGYRTIEPGSSIGRPKIISNSSLTMKMRITYLSDFGVEIKDEDLCHDYIIKGNRLRAVFKDINENKKVFCLYINETPHLKQEIESNEDKRILWILEKMEIFQMSPLLDFENDLGHACPLDLLFKKYRNRGFIVFKPNREIIVSNYKIELNLNESNAFDSIKLSENCKSVILLHNMKFFQLSSPNLMLIKILILKRSCRDKMGIGNSRFKKYTSDLNKILINYGYLPLGFSVSLSSSEALKESMNAKIEVVKSVSEIKLVEEKPIPGKPEPQVKNLSQKELKKLQKKKENENYLREKMKLEEKSRKENKLNDLAGGEDSNKLRGRNMDFFSEEFKIKSTSQKIKSSIRKIPEVKEIEKNSPGKSFLEVLIEARNLNIIKSREKLSEIVKNHCPNNQFVRSSCVRILRGAKDIGEVEINDNVTVRAVENDWSEVFKGYRACRGKILSQVLKNKNSENEDLISLTNRFSALSTEFIEENSEEINIQPEINQENFRNFMVDINSKSFDPENVFNKYFMTSFSNCGSLEEKEWLKSEKNSVIKRKLLEELKSKVEEFKSMKDVKKNVEISKKHFEIKKKIANYVEINKEVINLERDLYKLRVKSCLNPEEIFRSKNVIKCVNHPDIYLNITSRNRRGLRRRNKRNIGGEGNDNKNEKVEETAPFDVMKEWEKIKMSESAERKVMNSKIYNLIVKPVKSKKQLSKCAKIDAEISKLGIKIQDLDKINNEDTEVNDKMDSVIKFDKELTIKENNLFAQFSNFKNRIKNKKVGTLLL